MSAEVKFPHVHVQLTGEDGNAFMIMGLTQRAMRKAGLTEDDVKAYRDEAMSGDYDHLLQVTLRTVDVS